MAVAAAASGYTIQPLGTFGSSGVLAPGSRPYLTTDNTQRGLAYNATNNHVYVVNRAGGLSVPILDGDTGAEVGFLNTTGITGGTFTLSTIGVGADGAIYGANLTTNSVTSALKIYRWADESAVPTVAFSGSPTATANIRFGDNLAVRGSGASTQLVMGTGSTANTYSVFTTADGSSYAAKYMTIAGPPNGAFRLGIDFGPGDTVWGRQTGAGNTFEGTQFDLATQAATRLMGGPFQPTTAGEAVLAIEPTLNLMAAFDINSGSIRLYDITDPTFGLTLLDTHAFAGTHNTNGNGVGQMDFGTYGGATRLYVLDTNNGVQAFVVPEPASLLLVGLALLVSRRR